MLNLKCIMGLLPNALSDAKEKGLSRMDKTNFDVYSENKQRNFFGHYAKTVCFGQKWYLATVPKVIGQTLSAAALKCGLCPILGGKRVSPKFI